jgi:hypothetical protein
MTLLSRGTALKAMLGKGIGKQKGSPGKSMPSLAKAAQNP